MTTVLAGAIVLALQGVQATVAGTVRDGSSGRPLAHAVVTLTDVDRSVSTDAAGRYTVRGVPPGPQHMVVRHPGHAVRTLHALVPSVGFLEVDIALRPDPIALPALNVQLHVPMPGVAGDASGEDADRHITIGAVRTHPQLSEPDVLRALAGGDIQARPEAADGLHVRGGATDQTAYLIDGIPVFSPYHAAGLFSAWNPDALARVDLWSAAPSPALPDALGGVVSAQTRVPGARFAMQGGLSTTQARLTADGPLGPGGGGWLVSVRRGFPGAFVAADEPSYLRGAAQDWLVKLEVPVGSGRLRLLGFGSGNDIVAAADAGEGAGRPQRNAFDWRSQSTGMSWSRTTGATTVEARLWRATSAAVAAWGVADAPVALDAARRDHGIAVTVSRAGASASTAAGIRYERRRTAYLVREGALARPALDLGTRTALFAAFLQHARPLARRTGLEMGVALVAAGAAVHLSPRARVRWRPRQDMTISGSYTRTQQFAQSLRNAESVVGTVFPAELWVSAGAPGVPVARSGLGTLSIDYRPSASVRLSGQVYARRDRGILLVAPREGEPFSLSAMTSGNGAARGLSVDAVWSGRRYGLLATWGWQGVRYSWADSSYTPETGVRHAIEAGVIAFPSATSSIRVGAAAAFGRRTTPLRSAFEWESCNLLDAGCEFAGTPRHEPAPGSSSLPAYVRVDVGVRKHWHIDWRGRDVQLAAFGTLTNVLARTNLLTWAPDPATGGRTGIEMRPFAPLVAGLDWRF